MGIQVVLVMVCLLMNKELIKKECIRMVNVFTERGTECYTETEIKKALMADKQHINAF